MTVGSFRKVSSIFSLAILLSVSCAVQAVPQAQVEMRKQAQEPFGFPRPGADQTNVPLRTSFFFEFAVADQADAVLPGSVTMKLKPEGGSEFFVLKAKEKFQPNYSGKFEPSSPWDKTKFLSVNIDAAKELLPNTTYTLTLTATSRKGAVLRAWSMWHFTTEPAPTTHTLSYDLNLSTAPVRWTGGFFSGFCKPSFCTTELYDRIPGYELMDEVRQQYPKAWSVQRDWWITGFQNAPAFLEPQLPNVVRELETRRITSIKKDNGNIRIRVEDFFGHEQYGIPSGRPLSGDYHPGDVVQIVDGVNSAQGTVVSVNDKKSAVILSNFPTPSGGWKIAYTQALPKKEDSRPPGLFPPGGCYLRKFSPTGTPRYYWGRVDKEEDIVHRRFKRRLHVNFCDAPGDLSLDGKPNTAPKDFVEMREVAHAITSHFIERYGDAAVDFVWSIGNEPDLHPLFWRGDDTNFTAFQKYYDYVSDGILRAFEDHGYDSNRVFIGGLEVASVFVWGRDLTKRFLAHCSPTATFAGAVLRNEAYADPRLKGKRSRRVETLCSSNNGRGAPINFISVHCYTTAPIMAKSTISAKQTALNLDSVYYANLWVNSHESCPNWNPPPDVAASDSYLGNGYYPTWCSDVVRRQLLKASQDSRFGFGETILTFWPWPNPNFGGSTDATRVLTVGDRDDGRGKYTETVASPILRFLGLLSGMGDRYWVLPETTIGGHVVSGFASRGAKDVKVLLYSHDPLDTQSRSDQAFFVSLAMAGLEWSQAYVQEYRFDKKNNSFYNYAKQLGGSAKKEFTPEEADRTTSLSQLHVTRSYLQKPQAGLYSLSATVLGNGSNFIILTPNAPTLAGIPAPPRAPAPEPKRSFAKKITKFFGIFK